MSSQRVRSSTAFAVLAFAAALAGCDGPTELGDQGQGGSAATSGASGAATDGRAGGAGPAGSGSGAMGGVAGMSGTSGTATGGAAGTGGDPGQGGNAGSPGGTSGTAGSSAGASNGGVSGAPTGGSAGSGAGSGGSGGAAVGSAGCGKAVTQTARQWVEMPALDVSGAMRRWWTYLPNNYDPTRRYPVVFLFHGCGTETNNVPMQNVVGENAILVRSKAVADCWVTDTNSADVAFFDALVPAVEAGLCVDTSRRFAVGYSSGSWLINTLECVRGGVLRAAASVAGGTSHRGNCTNPSLARLFVHDHDDPDRKSTRLNSSHGYI